MTASTRRSVRRLLAFAFAVPFAALFALPFSGAVSRPLEAAQYTPPPVPTDVGGELAVDTTWTLAGSPYRLINHFRVLSGVTLTIDPGVVVEAADDWFFEIEGTLRAIGTPGQPIAFRKSVTNGTGWRGLRFLAGSVPYDVATGTGSVIAHATIRDMSYSGAAVSLSNASPLLTDLDVVNFHNSGIVGSGQAGFNLVVRNSRIHDGNYSPLALSGAFVAERNEIYNSFIGQNCTVSVTGGLFRWNHVHNNGGSLAICPGTGATIEENTIVDNGAIGIALRGGSGQIVRGNTLGGHALNVAVIGQPSGVTLTDNNFVGPLSPLPSDPCMPLPRQYHLAVFNSGCGVFGGPGMGMPGPYTLDAPNNYWGTADPAQIAAAIRDSADDLTLDGTVTTAPPRPGANVLAGALGYTSLSVVRVQPAAMLTSGGPARIFGHDFAPTDMSVTVSGVEAQAGMGGERSATTFETMLPAAPEGLRSVIVAHPDGRSATLANAVRYLDPALDADGDGLTNAQELTTYGTDAQIADSDGDGVNDGAEVAGGTNPLDPSSLPGVTVVGGELSTDTTWTLAGSPYRLTNHVRVLPGVTLTIDPGVVVEAAGDWFLEVKGTLRAVGTPADAITFRKTTTNATGWLGLRFAAGSTPYDLATDTGSAIAHATIRDMSYNGAAVSLWSASPLLTDLDVVNFRNGGIVGSGQAGFNLVVRNSRIHDGNYSPLALSGGFVAEGNEIFNSFIGQNCTVSVTGGVFRWNYVHHNGGSLAICPGTGATIEENTIVDNGAIGIALRGGTGQVVRGNTLGGHALNVAVIGQPGAVTLADNNFVGPLSALPSDPCMPLPRQYHLAVFNSGCGVFGGPGMGTPGPYTLDAANNYWGTTDPAQIAAAIRDSADDLTLFGTVNAAPSRPSANVSAGALGYPALSVVRVQPATVLTSGGLARIFGHDFAPAGMTVTVNGAAPVGETAGERSATTFETALPAAPAGLRSVTVTHPDGRSATLANAVRYLEPALDADGDGLTNAQELTTYGTDAQIADSDGDGVNDGAEVAGGTNPLDPASLPGVTVVGGELVADTTWTLAGSPYRLTNHVRVLAGVTLTIDPGVVVEAANDWFLETHGTLRAIGTPAQPITFRKTGTNGTGWLGLRFLAGSAPYDPAMATGSVIAHATIRDMSYSGAAVSLSNASPLLTDLDVVSFNNGGIVGSAQAGFPLVVRNSRIHNGNYSPLVLSGAFTAEHNEVYANGVGQNCVVSVTGGLFRRNYVHNNSGSLAICPGTGATIEQNTIVDNGAIGVALRGGSGQVVRGNTLRGHKMNVAVIGQPSGVTLTDNNFVGPLSVSPSDPCMPLPREYHVAVFNSACGVFGGPGMDMPGPYTLAAAGNYWGTTDPAEIAAAIRDSADDLTLFGTVNYTPSLGAHTNVLPIANAGPDQTVSIGAGVTLNGVGSADPDGDALQFKWYQVSGPGVVLQDPATDTPSFTASNPGTFVFGVTVHDGRGGFAHDTVQITATPPPPTIAVTLPSDGMVWRVGTPRPIMWSHNLGALALFHIDISRDGGATWQRLASGVPSQTATVGTFRWVVSGAAPAAAVFRVSSATSPTVFGVSGTVRIQRPIRP